MTQQKRQMQYVSLNVDFRFLAFQRHSVDTKICTTTETSYRASPQGQEIEYSYGETFGENPKGRKGNIEIQNGMKGGAGKTKGQCGDCIEN